MEGYIALMIFLIVKLWCRSRVLCVRVRSTYEAPFEVKLNMRFIGGVRYIPPIYRLDIKKSTGGVIKKIFTL